MFFTERIMRKEEVSLFEERRKGVDEMDDGKEEGLIDGSKCEMVGKEKIVDS
jgi:hypothetical protein